MSPETETNIQIEHKDGIAVVWLDKANSEQNILSFDSMSNFEEIFDGIANDDSLSAVVLISKKKDFVAGFDINSFKAEKEGDFLPFFQEGHRILQYIEDFPKPIVAAVHGTCYGLGTEIALACKGRIASNHPSTKFGLPEVKLGILPAGGGTQRLPRLIGLSNALDMMVTGKNIFAYKARKIGLVDELVNENKLLAAACILAKSLAKKPTRRQRKIPILNRFLDHTFLGNQIVFNQARKRIMKMTQGFYPAPLAIIDSVQTGFKKGMQAGYLAESENCEKLIIGDVSKELMRIFFSSTAKKKNPIGLNTKPISRIGVLGAGFMGAGIAEVSIKNGIDVFIKDVSDATISQSKQMIWKRLQKKVKQKALSPLDAKRIIHRMSGNIKFSDLSRVDLVIEAVFENIELKKEIIAEVESHPNDDTIIASNTSSLSITEMAVSAKRPENIIGMHYFSPVPLMPLLEIVRTKTTADQVAAACYDIGVKQGKTCIIVKDSPGFYVNRILSPYMNEALLMVDEGGDVASIDRAIKAKGLPIGPLSLMDQVGLDICASVMSEEMLDQLDENQSGPISLSAKTLYDKGGLLGKKGGSGFYIYNKKTGKQIKFNPEVDKILARDQKIKIEVQDIQDRLFMCMINEAVVALQGEIIESPQDGDIGAIFGMGFPPFMGGPFRLIDAMGADQIVATMERLAEKHGDRFTPTDLLYLHQKKGQKFYTG